jgi:thiol-disulfide isomerase/thioredoxin
MLSHKKTIRFDIIWSIISFVTSFILLTYFDLGVGSILLGVIVFLVGIIRGVEVPNGIWIKSLILAAPYAFFLIGALNGVFHLLFLSAICIIGSLLGVMTRRATMSRKRIVLLFAPIYIIGLYFYGTNLLPKYEDETMWAEVEKPFPVKFKLLRMNGDTLYSEELKDRILILDFWASWCGPCNKELPVLEKLHDKYRSDERVMFLVIACDRGDSLSKVKTFIQGDHTQLPFFVDLPVKLYKRCELGPIPAILMVDSKGIIRYEHRGYSAVENFETEFDKRMANLLK